MLNILDKVFGYIMDILNILWYITQPDVFRADWQFAQKMSFASRTNVSYNKMFKYHDVFENVVLHTIMQNFKSLHSYFKVVNLTTKM